MEEQFVTYEIALKLKELGFDEPCFAWFITDMPEKNIHSPILAAQYKDWTRMYNDRVNAPLWQQVIDWFREKYNIHIWITYNREYDNPYFTCIVDISQINRITTGYCKEYSAAREQAILKSIELILNKTRDE